MSLVLTSLVVAGGVVMGRWIGRSAFAKPSRSDDGARPPAAVIASKIDPLLDFPCHLGDVVMRTGGDEAWLAGAIVFSEELPTAILFIAPDAGGDRALYVRPKPNEEIIWLLPLAPNEILVGSEPPSSLEHKGERFERARRLPVRAERQGTGAPDVGEQVVLAEYTCTSGDRLLLLFGARGAHAWRGTWLEPGMYEVLASGKSTLEP